MTTENTSEVASPATEGADTTTQMGVKEVTGTQDTKAASSVPTLDTTSGTLGTNGEMLNEKPAYQPDYKFKALNKEYEIDEFLRGVLKDKETEKKLKDTLTKAYAFDEYKSRNDSLGQTYNSVLQEYQALDSDVKRVMTFRNNGDLTNFFAATKISKQDIYDWVKQQIQLDEAPPEQRQAFQQQQMLQQRAYELEEENTQVQDLYRQAAQQARSVQLDMVLSRPDVSQKAAAWDQKVGQLGAFRDQVIREAKMELKVSQRDLSAEEAVDSVLQRYGKFIEMNTQAPAMSATPQAQVQNVQVKPVIPTIAGKGTSPVKKKPNSIDDIRAMAREAQAQQEF